MVQGVSILVPLLEDDIIGEVSFKTHMREQDPDEKMGLELVLVSCVAEPTDGQSNNLHSGSSWKTERISSGRKVKAGHPDHDRFRRTRGRGGNKHRRPLSWFTEDSLLHACVAMSLLIAFLSLSKVS